MPGGLLNIISTGNQNIILNGNPSMSFFKKTYLKYTNFGMQKFRIDYQGGRELRLNESSTFTFKMPRHAELLMDAYLVFNLPDIWSPIRPPLNTTDCWKPYQFRWVPHIGVNAILEVTFSVGGQVIQRLSGDYLRNLSERDYTNDRKQLYHKMIGHEYAMYKPEVAYNRYNSKYPNIFYRNTPNPPEPSIRGKTLYVPLSFWFMHTAKNAFPFVALQYEDVQIDVTMRPIRELFTINDVSLTRDDGFDPNNLEPIQPNFTNEWHSLYRFLQPPPDITLESDKYAVKPSNWNADVHLLCTYCFLTEEESYAFAKNEQKYIIKDIRDYTITNVTGARRISLDTNRLVTSWMWFFRRHDVYRRNQWSNYTNWPYFEILPYDVIDAPSDSTYVLNNTTIGPGRNFTGISTDNGLTYETTANSIYINPEQNIYNNRDIMTRFAILLDGQYREVDFHSGVYQLVDKFRTGAAAPTLDGLYSYSFSLSNNPADVQPSGAINLSRFKLIELDVSTMIPALNPEASYHVICDTEGTVIGTTQVDMIYEYTYDLTIHEESWNMLRFISGHVGLLFAR